MCNSFQSGRTTWNFNGGSLPPNANKSPEDDNTLLLRRIARENEGDYECIGVLNRPNNPKCAAVGHLNVTG